VSAIKGDVASNMAITRDSYDIQDFVREFVQLAQLTCPYSEVIFSIVPDPVFLRSTQYSTYPFTQVFLDFQTVFNFTLTVKPSEEVLLYSISVTFRFPQLQYFDLQVQREESYTQNLVIFTIIVTELGNLGQYLAPGNNPKSTPLDIQITDSTLACEDQNVIGSIKSVATYGLVFFAGCAPGQELNFDPVQSSQPYEGCDDGDDGDQTPCFHYNNDFYPVFNLWDTVLNVNNTYNGNFSFTIIGGGESIDSVRNFTESEIASYNLGTKSIYANVTQLFPGGFINSSTGIMWLCGVESPCGNLHPKLPHTPQYYFLIKISTIGVVGSYCDYSTTFIIRIHAIPLSFGLYFLVTVVTISFISGIVILGYIYISRFKNEWLLGYRMRF